MDEKLIRLILLFEEISVMLEICGENSFKIRAYQTASRAIETHQARFEFLLRENRLTEMKGIGSGLAEKIKEYWNCGSIALHTELTKKIPPGLFEILKIPGLGPKKVQTLWKKLKINTLEKLEAACRCGKIQVLAGFGEKTEQRILKGIEQVRSSSGSYLMVDGLSVAEQLIRRIRAASAGIAQITVAGSVRRSLETVHDVDILVSRNMSSESRFLADSIADHFDHESITAHGETKVSVKLPTGPNVDFRIVSEKEYPYALLYFTGSKGHNTRLRMIAKTKGLKLNEYGLFQGTKNVPCANEADIYNSLGLAFIPPTLREDSGEIEAAQANSLPNLIQLKDIKGVLHVHTTASDGLATMTDLAEAAQKTGLNYLGITDHSESASYAGGLKVERIIRQHAEIDDYNRSHSGNFRIFKGIESDIRVDGSLDYRRDVLDTFDFIIGSIHSRFMLDRAAQTQRLIRAIENPYLTILGHLSGRLLLSRPEYDVDLEKVIDAAIANGVIVEFNCHPQRFDIDWRLLRKAKDRGLMTSINPDAHSVAGLYDISHGVNVIQKAWIEPKNVINTLSLTEISDFFASRKALR